MRFLAGYAESFTSRERPLIGILHRSMFLLTSARSIAFIVASIVFLQLLDGAIIATSLPQMAADLNVTALNMSLGVTSYLMAAAAFMPLSAWLADRVGAVRVFLLAIAIFTLASLACGLAQDLPQFVAARIVQGLGGAFMVPVGRVIALRKASKSEVIDVLAAMIWPALLAPVIGPVLGGAITTYFSWRYNFFINLPLGAVGFALVAILVREDTAPQPRAFDWPGFAFSGGGMALVLVGLEVFVHVGDAELAGVALIGLGVAVLVWGVRHLGRTVTPLLDLGAFRKPSFALSTITGGSYIRLAVDAMPFLLPIMFQVGMGLTPLESGALMLAYFGGNITMKAVTTPILRRFGFRNVLLVNGLICAVTIAGCGYVVPQVPTWAVCVVLAASGLSRSMQFTALSSLAFADVDAEQRGAASTLISMVQQLTLVFAVALATLVLKVSKAARGGEELNLFDFQVAITVMALLAGLSVVLMRRLDATAGDELAGRAAGESVRLPAEPSRPS